MTSSGTGAGVPDRKRSGSAPWNGGAPFFNRIAGAARFIHLRQFIFYHSDSGHPGHFKNLYNLFFTASS